jgi:hypothetical protein
VADHGAAYAATCIESGTPPLIPAEASSSLLGEHVMPGLRSGYQRCCWYRLTVREIGRSVPARATRRMRRTSLFGSRLRR